MNDLRTALPLRFGLTGDGPLHFLWKVHIFDLHGSDLYAPRFRLLIDDALQIRINLFSFREQIVELALAEHASQGGLCHLRGGVEVILNRQHGALRVYDSEKYHRVDLDGNVVSG